MFLAAMVLVSALAVPLFGGRLAALAEVRARFGPVLLLALLLQVVSINAPGIPEGLRPVLQLASYPVAGVFLVANRRLPGMLLVGLGALLNVVAMSANGGVMPASPSALVAAGLPLQHQRYVNSGLVEDARLSFLGDVFAIPEPVPLHNVFSVGDICIGLGVAVAMQRLCGSRLRRPRGRHERSRRYRGKHLVHSGGNQRAGKAALRGSRFRE
ncbi:MAG TPA: DUF5317 domain-containing protein [Actinomycetes bacterium]|jgi:hypothetical protein|nr:DUF5317 domain-containing protein [Actinomycetes bacterium]